MTLLALGSARQLFEQYGPEGPGRIACALLDAAEAMEEGGAAIDVVLPDIATRLAGELRDAALRELPSRRRIGGVLLIGGDRVTPFFRLPNPVRNRSVDPDVEVLSDAPYGELETSVVPVGRLPDGDPPNLDALLASIHNLSAPGDPARMGIFAVANQQWATSVAAVVAGHGARLRQAPPWSARDPEWSVSDAACLYFNLHGLPDRSAWRAVDDDTGVWSDVIRPEDVTPGSCRGAVVFSESCYGAQVVGRTAASSLALAFMASGCRAFVGATGQAYGSYAVNLRPRFADALAREFVGKILGAEPCGAALLQARQSFKRRSPGGFAQKTADQFVLYGNPLATL